MKAAAHQRQTPPSTGRAGFGAELTVGILDKLDKGRTPEMGDKKTFCVSVLGDYQARAIQGSDAKSRWHT